MRNGITYNSTTKRHLITPIFFYFLSYFLSPLTSAEAVFINVYLKLSSPNQIAPLINSFNEFLKQDQIIKTYKVKPFLEHRPLHVTLYLTHYKKKYTEELIRRIKTLAQQESALLMNSNQFQVSTNAYVMLTVKKSKDLQQLSDKTVHLLMSLHDKNAAIPLWAANDDKKRALFKHYGSPGVLTLFNPHFSIIDPEHLNSRQQNNLVTQLQQLVQQFTSLTTTNKTAKAYALAVGIADNQGQIIKELASFPLK